MNRREPGQAILVFALVALLFGVLALTIAPKPDHDSVDELRQAGL